MNEFFGEIGFHEEKGLTVIYMYQISDSKDMQKTDKRRSMSEKVIRHFRRKMDFFLKRSFDNFSVPQTRRPDSAHACKYCERQSGPVGYIDKSVGCVPCAHAKETKRTADCFTTGANLRG